MSATENLHALVWSAAINVGRNPPRIADEIIRNVCPKTLRAADKEGVSSWLRLGLIKEVKRILKAANDDGGQHDFAEIDPAFHSIVRDLKSKAYFVERLGEVVAIPQLIADPGLLDDARQFMRQKGRECLDEADKLDQLYFACTGRIAAE